jgi:hypothetical protein
LKPRFQNPELFDLTEKRRVFVFKHVLSLRVFKTLYNMSITSLHDEHLLNIETRLLQGAPIYFLGILPVLAG